MSDNKTKPTKVTVKSFLASVEPAVRKADGYVLLEMMQRVTGNEPVMWGPTIVGFDQYHYKYDSGREGDMCMVGFSPRKAKHSLYFTPGYGQYDHLIAKLGKVKTGASCVYINKLADIDMAVLEEITHECITHMRKTYGSAL